jgi:hypothetical protein
LSSFFLIDKTDASNDLWDQFESLEAAPCFRASKPSSKTMVRVAIREPQLGPVPSFADDRPNVWP